MNWYGLIYDEKYFIIFLCYVIYTFFMYKQETTLVVYAKIHKIHKEHGWNYLACRKCNTAVKEQPAKGGARQSANKKPTYKCEPHGVQVPVPKYFRIF